METNTVAFLAFSLFLFVSWLQLMDVKGVETTATKTTATKTKTTLETTTTPMETKIKIMETATTAMDFLKLLTILQEKNEEVLQTKKRDWLESQKWEFMVTYMMSLKYLQMANEGMKVMSDRLDNLDLFIKAIKPKAIKLKAMKLMKPIEPRPENFVDFVDAEQYVDQYVELKLKELDVMKELDAPSIEMTKLKEQDKRLILAFLTLDATKKVIAHVIAQVMNEATDDATDEATDEATDHDLNLMNQLMDKVMDVLDAMQKVLYAMQKVLYVIDRFSDSTELENLKKQKLLDDEAIQPLQHSSDKEENALMEAFSSGREGPQSNGNGKAVAAALLAFSFALVFLAHFAFYMRRRRQKNSFEKEQ